jgi:hypothetical protein
MLMPVSPISAMPGGPGRFLGGLEEHGGREFFVLADVGKSPLAVEPARRILEIFAIEREIDGPHGSGSPFAQEGIRPLVGELVGMDAVSSVTVGWRSEERKHATPTRYQSTPASVTAVF